MTRIRIAIAEDQHLFRQSLSELIDRVPGFELVAGAEHGGLFLQAMTTITALPDIALIDMEMPDMNGIQLNTALRREYPEMKVIILSVHTQQRLIATMMEAGVCAYLAKNCDKDELIHAIQSVQKTGFYINNSTLKALREPSPLKKKSAKSIHNFSDDLTTREKEILQLICLQYNNTEIGAQLFISARTVEGHRNNLLLKTGSRNTVGLVLYAIQHGIIAPPLF